MTITEFLRLHPNIKNDARVYLPNNGFDKLHVAIEKSDFLKNTFSLRWLVRNYDRIIAGEYNSNKNFRSETEAILPGEQDEEYPLLTKSEAQRFKELETCRRNGSPYSMSEWLNLFWRAKDLTRKIKERAHG